MKGALQRFERALASDWSRHPRQTQLHKAVMYALNSGGKRFRPLVVLSVAEGVGLGRDVMPAALAVEYFHTASLIADDLPCMDNDLTRRGKPALHIAFDETTALLSSYALICSAFEQIHINATRAPSGSVVGMLALQQAAKAAGINGATCGQFLDLYPDSRDLKAILEVLNLKTVTLFETAYVLGWLFGGGAVEKLSAVKKAAGNFGLAFQIADDLSDYEQDCPRKGSTNIAVELGREKARDMIDDHLKEYDTHIEELELKSGGLSNLRSTLIDYVTAASG